uniref:Uncharacterized protein n=1 Tax=Graphocephala atropunctata TaxID=36148 RepID=A0A1B6KYE5_9HEMI
MDNTRNDISKPNTPNNFPNTEEACPSNLPHHNERRQQTNILNQDVSPHLLYPPMPGYLPFYPLPWQYMNIVNLDLMRQLTVELGLRNCGPINEITNWNFLRELQTKRSCGVKKRCQGEEQSHFGDDDCRVHLPRVCKPCTCCVQQLRCSCCSACIHPIAENRVTPCKCCHHIPESCMACHDVHIPTNRCHHHCQIPKRSCCLAAHSIREHSPVDFIKKENVSRCKDNKKVNVDRTLVLSETEHFDSNTKEVLDESNESESKSTVKVDRNQSISTVKQKDSEDAMKISPARDGEYYIVAAVGSGDERTSRSEVSVKCSNSRRPESYFLPISSLIHQ